MGRGEGKGGWQLPPLAFFASLASGPCPLLLQLSRFWHSGEIIKDKPAFSLKNFCHESIYQTFQSHNHTQLFAKKKNLQLQRNFERSNNDCNLISLCHRAETIYLLQPNRHADFVQLFSLLPGPTSSPTSRGLILRPHSLLGPQGLPVSAHSLPPQRLSPLTPLFLLHLEAACLNPTASSPPGGLCRAIKCSSWKATTFTGASTTSEALNTPSTVSGGCQRVLKSEIGCHRVLCCVKGCYRVSSGARKFYRELQAVNKACHMVSWCVIRCYIGGR